MIFVITGPDGSGKSTACHNVGELFHTQFGQDHVAIVSPWDSAIHSKIFASKKHIESYLNDLDGYTRTLFIFHALNRSIDLAMRRNPKIMLIDSFWYKYAVSEIGWGVSEDLVLNAAQGFLQPDLVFYLDVDQRLALARKQAFSDYEKGVGTGETSHYSSVIGSSREKFAQFQSRLSKIWTKIENGYGPWLRVSSDLPRQEVANKIYFECIDKLGTRNELKNVSN